MKFTIPKNTLKAALLMAAKNDVRYYLNGVCFQPHGDDVIMIATTGHSLLAHKLNTAVEDGRLDREFIIPRDTIESVLKTCGRSDSIEVELTNGSVTLRVNQFVITATIIDGKFPDWRKITPASCSGDASQIDPFLLAEVRKSGELIIGKSWWPGVNYNGNKCNIVTYDENTLFLVMPYRADPGVYVAPAWAAQP
jgi:DNA polymerase III subunit beta